MRTSIVLVVATLAACGTAAAPAPTGDAWCEAPASDAHTLGVPALDRLIALGEGPAAAPRMFVEDASGPRRLLFETEGQVLVAAAPRLVPALEAARSAALDDVSFEARVVLQNDLWGAWQRVDETPASAERDALLSALAGTVVHLAPTPAALEAHDGSALPTVAHAFVPEAEGWRERGTEHSVLSHEALFGMRRVFRVLTRNGELDRALVSQVVALDDRGEPHLTSIATGMEILEISGGVARARVLELSRHSLRCGPPRLVPMDAVHGLPGLGTNGHLAALDPPEAPTPSVCARCHEDVEGRDDLLMSLPNDDVARLPRRWAELLEQSRVSGRRVVASRHVAPGP